MPERKRNKKPRLKTQRKIEVIAPNSIRRVGINERLGRTLDFVDCILAVLKKLEKNIMEAVVLEYSWQGQQLSHWEI